MSIDFSETERIIKSGSSKGATMAKNDPKDWREAKQAFEEAKERRRSELEEQIAVLQQELDEMGDAPKQPKSEKKSARVCKTCGQSGHNARTCPQKPQAE